MKNKYAAGFFMGLKEEMQYRADYLTNLISVVFPLMIQLSLWTIRKAGGNRHHGVYLPPDDAVLGDRHHERPFPCHGGSQLCGAGHPRRSP